MSSEQGIAIAVVLLIGYVGWLLTSITLYKTRKKNRELEQKIKTLETLEKQ